MNQPPIASTYEIERYAKELYENDTTTTGGWKYLGEDLRRRYRKQAVSLLNECYAQTKPPLAPLRRDYDTNGENEHEQL